MCKQLLVCILLYDIKLTYQYKHYFYWSVFFNFQVISHQTYTCSWNIVILFKLEKNGSVILWIFNIHRKLQNSDFILHLFKEYCVKEEQTLMISATFLGYHDLFLYLVFVTVGFQLSGSMKTGPDPDTEKIEIG